MALSEIKRQRIRHTKEVLEELNRDNTVNESTQINEDVSGKFKDINDVAKYLNDRQFGYIELNKFDVARDDFNISIFFMSNKNVKVGKDNYISLNFEYEEYYNRISVYDTDYQGVKKEVTLEKFMELPISVEGDTDEKIQEVVDKCDTAYIYDLYLEEALNLVSESMNTAYQLFKNPGLFKMLDRSIATLGVTYMPKLKKFVYLYNPDFVLESTIEEWMKNRKQYESLRSCYVYMLAYYITHEMMHIIYNNTSTDNEGRGITDVNLSDDIARNHEISNIIQDSFINSELAIRFKRAGGKYGVRQDNGLAPIPKAGIDSRICLRGQHNVGFKEFKKQSDLVDCILDLYKRTAKLEDCSTAVNYKTDFDLSKYKGADIYILVDVNPRSRDIRQSSIVFQKFINDLVRIVTDGDIYERFAMFTEDEKVTDKDILPNGTLVRIKQTVDVCVIVGYDEDTGKYTLNNTDSTLVRNPLGDGTYECSYTYSDDGTLWGECKRTGFIPFEEDSYDNTWIEGVEKEEKRKLEPEDLQPPSFPPPSFPQGFPPTTPPQGDSSEDKRKTFRIGDIVYIRTAGVFGRITDIQDGRFELEEMREENARVIDDSMFH